jgi:hypothetical protein
MSSKPYNFKQRDLTRIIKATQGAGVSARFEVDTARKTITIIPIDDAPKNDGADAAAPTDTPESIIEQL